MKPNYKRAYLTDAAEISSGVLDMCKDIVFLEKRMLSKEELNNFRAACELLIESKKLSLDNKRISNDPVKMRAINSQTLTQLRTTSDSDLARLAQQLLSPASQPNETGTEVLTEGSEDE